MNVLENKRQQFLLIALLAIFIPWIILAIVFGIYDLQISNAVVNFESWWGNFGADYGETPGFGLIGISIAVLFGSFIKKTKMQKIPAFVISAIGITLMIYFLFDYTPKAATICGSIAGSVLIFSFLELNRDLNNYKKFAWLVLLLSIINPLGFVQITKLLCGRVRFRDLVDMGFEFYTPWYLPPEPTIRHMSFPSGHTAMGWMVLPLLVLVREKETKDPMKIITVGFVFLWGFFVACSRVVVGAHFASDVLFSTGMGLLAFAILYYYMYLKPKKVEKEENNPLE